MKRMKILWKLVRLLWMIIRDRFGLINNVLLPNLDQVFEGKSTCYILGAGPSINLLSETDLNFLSQGVSIGVNDFVLHPFVANVYSFEVLRDGEKFKNRFDLLREKMGKGSILSFKSPASIQKLGELKVAVGNEMLHMNYPMTFADKSSGEFSTSFRSYMQVTRVLNAKKICFNQASSVVKLAVLAAQHGVKKIVLVGVDLRGGYFWQYNQNEQNLIANRWGLGSGIIANEGLESSLPLSSVLEELRLALSSEFSCSLVWLRSWDLERAKSLKTAMDTVKNS